MLHSFGDSYAHVEADGSHYLPMIGHGLSGTKPDDPDKHPQAYSNYTMALYELAASASGSAGVAKKEVAALAASVAKGSSEDAQKKVLADSIKSAGGQDVAGLVDSPVSGCEWYEGCGGSNSGNTVNPVIQKIYGLKISQDSQWLIPGKVAMPPSAPKNP